MSSGDREDHQSGVVYFCGRHPTLAHIRVVEGRGGVGKKYDFVVTEQGVTSGGVAAVLGGDAGDDHGVYPHAAENDLQVSARKGAVAALGDDDLVSSGCDLRIDLDAGLTLHQTGPVPDRRPE